MVYSDLNIPRAEGSTVTYSCNTGYRLTGGEAVRTCNSNGWEGHERRCEGVYRIMFNNLLNYFIGRTPDIFRPFLAFI